MKRILAAVRYTVRGHPVSKIGAEAEEEQGAATESTTRINVPSTCACGRAHRRR